MEKKDLYIVNRKDCINDHTREFCLVKCYTYKSISSSIIPQKISPAIFKSSPLLSMFPGSPPYVAHNTSDVGDPLILTPLIENGDVEKARNLSKVDSQFSDIDSYTGFFTVNKKYNSNLFFWYVPAQVLYKDFFF